DFQGIYETQRQVNQGASTLLETVNTCYNGAPIPCTSTAVALPIANRTVQATLPGVSPSETYTTYNVYGLPTETDEYDFGGSTPTRKTIVSYDYNTSCGVTNGAVVNLPCVVQVTNGGGALEAQTTNTYDKNGNLITQAVITSGSNSLSRSFTYSSYGVQTSATDYNGNTTTYSNFICANNTAFPQSIASGGLTTTLAWDCNGAVPTSVTDANSQTTTYAHYDPFWRVTAITDPTNATTNIFHSANPYAVESSLNFNGSVSTLDQRTTYDGLGRAKVIQRERGQNSGTYDSVEIYYDSLGRRYQVSVPYSGGAGASYTGSSFTTYNYDALSRLTGVTDPDGGTSSTWYSKNDALLTVGPAPSGENTKRRQLEYDGLGRLTSVCEITSASGSGACSQNTAASGFFTSYSYDVLNDLLGVSQSGQSRTYQYDGLGRVTSVSDPESGSATLAYDSDATGHCSGTYDGDLVMRKDAIGNYTCYTHDALHRVKTITYPSGSYASVTPSKTFVYDSATVNGTPMAYAKGRLAEAYTGSSGSKITDLGFSYSLRGEVAAAYESTPNSGGYYRTTATYWANGLLDVLNLQNAAGTTNFIPTITYAPEGEGRVGTVSASSGQNPVTTTGYNVFGEVTGMTFGSGDSDAFNYDLNTGRMTQYKFTVNGSSVTGNVTWNQNGTLQQLAITDPFNSANQQ